MFRKIALVSMTLFSFSGFTLPRPPQTSFAGATVEDSLSSILGRPVTADEMNQVAAWKEQLDNQKATPQKVVNVLGLFEANAMVCAIGQGSAMLARVGGMGCVDLTYEPGTRYTITGAEFQTEMGGSVEGAVGLMVYVGPTSHKPFVGGFGVVGGILGLPIPFIKAGARTKYFANLDNQYMVFGGASLGISGQPLPVNFSAGAISVTKTDWLAGLHGEKLGTPDATLGQRLFNLYGNVIEFFSFRRP
ncbi:MAG: hypothetical protein AB7F86_08380 [Bdellovibrionales bacterium]